MRQSGVLVILCVATLGCVGIQPLPDPRGALRSGQRLVVAVYPAPGPWIIDASDSKLESAAKISPVGVFMQGFQDEHTLGVSKDLQQYLPRPHFGIEVHDALLQSLRQTLSTKTVQTTLEAGLVPDQLTEWNRAKDQLDWRLRYYGPDPDAPAPRDYSRALTLDDALILDVNVSYGTSAGEDGKILPHISAASRVYRGDTSRLIWEHEDELVDSASSSTLSEFKLQPWDLTNRLEKLAPQLGAAVSGSFTKAFLGISTATVVSAPSPASRGGGLVPTSVFQQILSSSTVATVAASTPTVVGSTAPLASGGPSASGIIPLSTSSTTAPAIPTSH